MRWLSVCVVWVELMAVPHRLGEESSEGMRWLSVCVVWVELMAVPHRLGEDRRSPSYLIHAHFSRLPCEAVGRLGPYDRVQEKASGHQWWGWGSGVES